LTLSATGRSEVGRPAGRQAAPARAALVLATLVLLLPRPSAAAIIDVGGSCTLAAAITAANDGSTASGLCSSGSAGPDEIRLTADVTLTQVDNTIAGDTGTAAGPNGLPQVVTEIVVEGNGYTIARGAGAPVFRIFSIALFGNLTLQNVTLSNGGGATFDYLGGAIANDFGGDITLTDATVSGNSAGGFFGGGGGIYNKGDAVITRTTISGNSAYIGGGLFNDGIADITNSTLSGNSGGLDKGGAIDNTGTVTLVSSTLSGNSAGNEGAGALNVFSGPAYLTNTLLADNSPKSCKTGSGSVNDNGGNLADDDTCGTIPDTLGGLDPSLADNGGPTRTHALLAGSNAIGLAATCGLATDQRGATRPAGACDSGAYEYIACPDETFDYETVYGTETREHCQQIVLGPDFVVAGTGNLTLRAGSAVQLGNDTSVDTDGQLAIEIDPDLQLIPPAP
jgi:hypothetical protein